MAISKKYPKNTVGIKELKDQASSIVDGIQKTRRPVIITRNNREVARIVPIDFANSQQSLTQKIQDLGLLAASSRTPWNEVKLEKLKLDASIALTAIREDRGED